MDILNTCCIGLFLTCLISGEVGQAYKILVTNVGVASSQNLIMFRFAEILAQNGHEVTILNAKVFKEVKSPKLRLAKELSYEVITDEQELADIKVGAQDNAWNSSVKAALNFTFVRRFFGTLTKSCERLIQQEDKPGSIVKTLQAERFDAIIVHLMDMCSFGLAHRLGIKATIWMSTAFSVDFMSWYSGAPTMVSYVPSGPYPLTGYGVLDRLKNAMYFCVTNVVFHYGVVCTYTELFRQRYGADFPSYGELFHNAQLHFINSDPFFEIPRPIVHKMIYVGGLTMVEPEPLDPHWQNIVDRADNGFIIFSLGSVANTSFMPTEYKRAFVRAFSKIPQTVVWRLEGDVTEARKVKNIITSEWLPQKDLLGNPKVKAFITHGGYNSLTEAFYAGVPLIMIPLFGDQYTNCKRVERLNVGLTLLRDQLNEESISAALNYVLNNQTIQENARRLGRMIRKKPQSSRESAVKWVEFLAEFQDLNLTPAGQHLSLMAYLMIDAILLVILLTILLLTSIIVGCLYLTKYCSRKLKFKKD